MRPGSQPKVCKVPFYYKSIKVTTPQRYIDDNEIHVDIGPRSLVMKGGDLQTTA